MSWKLMWNCWIIANYLGAMCWWGWWGSWVDVIYWLSAAMITATVTFGYGR
jgi:hypothetical protein